MDVKTNPLRDKIRHGKLPHFFCPGCGCGQVLHFYLRALEELGIPLEDTVAIGGVGCTARIPVYLKVDALHGVHGRTLPWAMGIKLHRPEIPVVVFAGDGDAASIGGNHLIHAARRNLDVTMIVVNNLNFAMTGGQVAPTTPYGSITMTTPHGSGEPAFDICGLAITAGATHVERWTTSQGIQVIQSMKRALKHSGFSLIEIVSQCPTHFGRYALGTGKPGDVIDWIDERTTKHTPGTQLSTEESGDKFVTGKFVLKEKPIFAGTTVFKGRECS